MPRNRAKRFQFQTVLLARDGSSSRRAKSHTSLANALHFCNAKNGESATQRGDQEYAVLVRTDKRPNKGGVLPLKADAIGTSTAKPAAEATSRPRGW